MWCYPPTSAPQLFLTWAHHKTNHVIVRKQFETHTKKSIKYKLKDLATFYTRLWKMMIEVLGVWWCGWSFGYFVLIQRSSFDDVACLWMCMDDETVLLNYLQRSNFSSRSLLISFKKMSLFNVNNSCYNKTHILKRSQAESHSSTNKPTHNSTCPYLSKCIKKCA